MALPKEKPIGEDLVIIPFNSINMKLDIRDVKFLLSHLQSETLNSKLGACAADDPKRTQFTVAFDEIELDALEDELTRLLSVIGLGENDEVNATGVYVESLIDLIRNEYE